MNKSDMQKTNKFLILNLILIFMHIFMERYVFLKQLTLFGEIIIGLFFIIFFVVLLSTWDILIPNSAIYTQEKELPYSYSVSKESDIVISKDCDKLYSYCYSGNKSITSVMFENQNTKIAEKAFFDCTKLSCIRLPENLTEISPFTFAFCEDLPEIRLPKKLTKIDEGAFLSCKKLKNIRICSSLIRIESSVFSNCTMLESIVIPCLSTRINIAEDAFIGVKDKSVEITTFSKSKVSEEDLQKILNETDLDKFKWLKH